MSSRNNHDPHCPARRSVACRAGPRAGARRARALSADGTRTAARSSTARSGPTKSAEVEKLPGAVVVGNPQGDVTLAEFYDLNCPFCRRASADVETLIKADPQIARRVGAVSGSRHSFRARRPRRACRRKIGAAGEILSNFIAPSMPGRGTIDGQRALALATGEFGLDAQKIVDAANDDAITETMKSHLRFADSVRAEGDARLSDPRRRDRGPSRTQDLAGRRRVRAQMRKGGVLKRSGQPPDCTRGNTRRTADTSEPDALIRATA